MVSETPRGAGRPPTHVDKAGKKILTAPISINIPIRMIDWIAEQKQINPKFNVSRYMVDLIQKSMDGGMCPNCYGTNLQERSIGLSCEDCTAKRMQSEGGVFNKNLVHYVCFYNCENCDTPLDLWNQRAYFGASSTKKAIRGCTVCARLPFENPDITLKDAKMLKQLQETPEDEDEEEEEAFSHMDK